MAVGTSTSAKHHNVYQNMPDVSNLQSKLTKGAAESEYRSDYFTNMTDQNDLTSGAGDAGALKSQEQQYRNNVGAALGET